MVSLLDLRTAIRQRADIVGSTYITDSELTSYVNNSVGELYDLIEEQYERYAVTGPLTLTVTTISDDGYAGALASDFYKLVKLQRQDVTAPSRWISLRPFNLKEQEYFDGFETSTSTFSGRFETRYALIDQNLYLSPYSTAAGTYRYWYTPFPTVLVNDGDSLPRFMTGPAWHEYIIVDAVIKIYQKQEDDASAFEQSKAMLTARIRGIAANRDEGDTPTVVDVTRRRTPWGGSYGGW